MAIVWKHADGPGKITGAGQNGTPTMDFERLTTGQIVMIAVDFSLQPSGGSVSFEIIAGDGDAVPLTPNRATVQNQQHVSKQALFKVTKEADPAVGVVEVPFELNFTSGSGDWGDYTMIGETVPEH